MLLKLLLKIWPGLIPIGLYLLWVVIKRKNRVINASYQELDKDGNPKTKSNHFSDFSLKNRQFVFTLYLSLAIFILCFLFFALRVPKIEGGNYIPAHMEGGELIPAKIIQN